MATGGEAAAGLELRLGRGRGRWRRLVEGLRAGEGLEAAAHAGVLGLWAWRRRRLRARVERAGQGAELLRGLAAGGGALGRRVLERAAEHRVQVALAEVTPAGKLERHGLRLAAEPVYPASCIKLCAAVAALRKVQDLQARGVPLTADTALRVHVRTAKAAFPGGALVRAEAADPSNRDGGAITIAHLIRKVFLVSDNPAFNWLLDFADPGYVEDLMAEHGLESVRLRHHLREDPFAEAQACVAVQFDSPDGPCSLPLTQTWREPPAGPACPIGKAHVDAAGAVRAEPLDLAKKNRMSLSDMQEALILLTREERPFGLTDEHRRLLTAAMAASPATSANPRYAGYADGWNKFFQRGLRKVLGRSVEIYNKLGQAYGFSLDTAYVVDRRTGVEFYLAACIYTNKNGILNDGAYEYAAVGEPFLELLGERVAHHLLWKRRLLA